MRFTLSTFTLIFSIFLYSPVLSKGAGHGELCDSGKDCDRSKNLYCITGICSCVTDDPSLIEYDDKVGCRALIGGKCNFAEFLHKEWIGVTQPCVNGTCTLREPRTARCECKGRTVAPDRRSCLQLTFGSACNRVSNETKDHCTREEGLICYDGKCRCQGSNVSEFFDEIDKKCYKLHGVPCTNNPRARGNSSEGQTEAQCDPQRSTCGLPHTGWCKSNLCICNHEEGWIDSGLKGHRCYRGYNATCGTKGYDCKPNSGLKCIDNTCSCELDPDSVWDPQMNRCALREGSRCENDQECKTMLTCLKYGTSTGNPNQESGICTGSLDPSGNPEFCAKSSDTTFP